MPRECVNDPNKFCYVCGSLMTKNQQRSITGDLMKLYKAYFGCPLGDQDKSWAPHKICTACACGLRDWATKKKKSMPFAIPMIWREPKDHTTDCYFCLVNTKGFSAKTKNKIVYHSLESAMRPVPHDESLPIPAPPEDGLNSDENSSDTDVTGNPVVIDPDYEEEEDAKLNLFSQAELNDLVRDLSLSKQKAEILASRLQEKGLLEKSVNVSYYRKRNFELSSFFTVNGPLCYCNDILGLFEALVEPYDPTHWRLFIDSSKTSVKAVLLHDGNTKPSIPIAHSVHLKETYDSMDILLSSINYSTHKWFICGDLKVIGMLMGMQSGFTKFCCFLCLWDSRATSQHYIKSNWELRSNYTPGKVSVSHLPLVAPEKIYLPPLHIKLGLMKNFVKAMAKTNSLGFQYLCKKFPKLSEAKLKEGIFVGPQIREVFNDREFEASLNDLELEAWKAFKWVCENFLGNYKSPT